MQSLRCIPFSGHFKIFPSSTSILNTQYIQNGTFSEYVVFYEVPDEEEDKDLKILLKDLESLSEHREAIENIVDSRIKEKLDSIAEKLDLLDKVVKEVELFYKARNANQSSAPIWWPPAWPAGYGFPAGMPII
jgi:hypothetical protein